MKAKKYLIVSLSSLLLLSGCSLPVLEKEEKNTKTYSEQNKEQIKVMTYNSLDEILQNKKISNNNYKDFINIFLIKSKSNFPSETIESKMKLTLGDLLDGMNKERLKEAKITTRAKLAIQKTINNSVTYDSSEKWSDYDYVYKIMYINTRDFRQIGNTELLNYMRSETSSENHLDNIQNFDIFNAYISKENSSRINNSFEILQKENNDDLYVNEYKDSENIKTYSVTKKLEGINTPLILKEKMIILDIFKENTKGKSNADTLLNMFKFIDNNSDELNLDKNSYKSLKDNLNNLSEETLNNMINYILELYINEYYKLLKN